jgi:hypothetical protein
MTTALLLLLLLLLLVVAGFGPNTNCSLIFWSPVSPEFHDMTTSDTRPFKLMLWSCFFLATEERARRMI